MRKKKGPKKICVCDEKNAGSSHSFWSRVVKNLNGNGGYNLRLVQNGTVWEIWNYPLTSSH